MAFAAGQSWDDIRIDVNDNKEKDRERFNHILLY